MSVYFERLKTSYIIASITFIAIFLIGTLNVTNVWAQLIKPEFIEADSLTASPGTGSISGVVQSAKEELLDEIVIAAIEIPTDGFDKLPMGYAYISDMDDFIMRQIIDSFLTPSILFTDESEIMPSPYSPYGSYGYAPVSAYGLYGLPIDENNEALLTINIYKTSTNSSGQFIMSGINPGEYLVVAYDPTTRGYIFSGYPIKNAQIDSIYASILADEATEHEISKINLTSVSADEAADTLTICLELGGNLTGKVFDKYTKKPLEGIQFIASPIYDQTDINDQIGIRVGNPIPCVSNDKGEIAFLGLAEGKYHVQAVYTGKYLPPHDENPNGTYGGLYTGQYSGGYGGLYGISPGTGDQSLIEIKSGKTITGCDYALELGGIITGKILSQTDKKPIEGIYVMALQLSEENNQMAYPYYMSPIYSGGEFGASAITKADGTYSIFGLSSGAYKLAASLSQYPYYYPQSLYYGDNSPPISPNYQGAYYGDTKEIDQARTVSVIKGKETSGCDIHLKQASLISGKMIDAKTKKPLSGILVRASFRLGTNPQSYVYPSFIDLQEQITKTDSSGVFTLTGLVAGYYMLSAEDINKEYQDTDYCDECIEDKRCIENELYEGPLMRIENAETIEGLIFPMHLGGCIKGRLINAEGEGISFAMLELRLESKGDCKYYPGPAGEEEYEVCEYTRLEVSETLFADKEGYFSLCGLKQGEYTLEFRGGQGGIYNNPYLRAMYNNKDVVNAQGKISITGGQQTECGAWVLQKGGSISGIVINAAGEPLGNVTISTESIPDSDRSNRFYQQTETARDGSFSLIGLPSDFYKIEARDYNSNYLETTYCPGSHNAAGDDECLVKVLAPNETSLIKIVMQKGGIISGRVVDAQSGRPLQYLSVEAINISDIPDRYLSVEANDISDIPDRSSGYSLGGYYSPYGPQSYLRTSANAISDKEGNYKLTGLDGGSYIITIKSDQTPLYATSLYGVYPEISDTNQDYEYLGQYYSDVLNLEDAIPVKIAPEDTISGIDFHLQKGASISGTLFDSKTLEPIREMITIELIDSKEQVIKITTINTLGSGYYPTTYYPYIGYERTEASSLDNADNNGTYKISAISSGRYFVRVSRAQNYFDAYYHINNEERTVIDLADKADIEDIDIFLEKKGSISGKVLREMDNKPLANVMVQAMRVYEPSGNYSASPDGQPYGGYTPNAYSQTNIAASLASSKYEYGVSYTGGEYSPYGYGSPYPSYQASYVASAYTDDDGNYLIQGLDPGEYSIYASDLNYTYQNEYYKNIPFDKPEEATKVKLERGEAQTGINFLLSVGATYQGMELEVERSANEFDDSANMASMSLYGGYYGGYTSTSQYSSLGASASYAALPIQTTALSPYPVPPVSTIIAQTGYMPSPDFDPTQSQNSNFSSGIANSPSSYAPLSSQAGSLYGGMMPQNAPQIISEAEDEALAGHVYTYQIAANKPDGNNDGLIYSLEIAPNTMNIDNQSGLITWSPQRDDVGPKVIKLKVVADNGMIATQAYQLNVIDDTTPPEDVTAFTAQAGDKSVTLSWNLSADSAGDLASYLLYIDSGNGYEEPVYLETDNSSYQTDGLSNNIAYTFKLTAIDHNNNESAGVLTSATPSLPQQPLIQQTYTNPFFQTQTAYTDFSHSGGVTAGYFLAPYWTSWEWTKDLYPYWTWQSWNNWPINNGFTIPSWDGRDFQFKDIFQNLNNSWQRKTNNTISGKTVDYYLR